MNHCSSDFAPRSKEKVIVSYRFFPGDISYNKCLKIIEHFLHYKFKGFIGIWTSLCCNNRSCGIGTSHQVVLVRQSQNSSVSVRYLLCLRILHCSLQPFFHKSKASIIPIWQYLISFIFALLFRGLLLNKKKVQSISIMIR